MTASFSEIVFPNNTNSSVLYTLNDTGTLSDTAEGALYYNFRYTVYYIVIPCILFIGILGNTINLVVFSHRISQSCVDRLERSATSGLIAIALSDLLFCLTGFPAAFAPRDAHYMEIKESPGAVLGFYYNVYKPGFVSLFLLISTWLILIISVERYLAVCHPIRARWIISLKKTVIAQCTVAGLAALVCVPVFSKYNIEVYACDNNYTCYLKIPNLVFWTGKFMGSYKIFSFIACTLIPLVVLVYCNIRLILVLYESKRRGITDPDRYCTTRITTVVVGIISTYAILVAPSSLLDIVVWAINDTICEATRYKLRIGQVTCNLLQAIKFASNFVLYCSINKQFRHSLGQALKRVSNTGKITSRMTSDTTRRVDLIESSR